MAKIYIRTVLDLDTYLKPNQCDENVKSAVLENAKDKEGHFEKGVLIITINRLVTIHSTEIDTNYADGPITVRATVEALICNVTIGDELTMKLIGGYKGYVEFASYCVTLSVSEIDIDTYNFATKDGIFYSKKKRVTVAASKNNRGKRKQDDSDDSGSDEDVSDSDNDDSYELTPLEIGYFRIRVTDIEPKEMTKKGVKTVSKNILAGFGHLLSYANPEQITEYDKYDKFITKQISGSRNDYFGNSKSNKMI